MIFALLTPSGQGTLPEIRCVQLFKMARNCLDRGEKIYTTAKQEQRPLALFRLASPSPTVSPTLLTSPVDNGKVEKRGALVEGVLVMGGIGGGGY